MYYGVPNKERLGSGVPHREPSVLHAIVEAVAGDLGASQASSQPYGEGGEADEGKSSCLMSRMGVARGERETTRERHPEDGSVQFGEWHGLLEAGVQSSTSSSGVTPCPRGVRGGGCLVGAGRPPALQEKTWAAHPGLTRLPDPVPDPPAAGAGLR